MTKNRLRLIFVLLVCAAFMTALLFACTLSDNTNEFPPVVPWDENQITDNIFIEGSDLNEIEKITVDTMKKAYDGFVADGYNETFDTFKRLFVDGEGKVRWFPLSDTYQCYTSAHQEWWDWLCVNYPDSTIEDTRALFKNELLSGTLKRVVIDVVLSRWENGDNYLQYEQPQIVRPNEKLTEPKVKECGSFGTLFAWYSDLAFTKKWSFETDAAPEENAVIYGRYVNEVELLECENGRIEFYPTSITTAFWFGAFYGAIPDDGYYFERWAYYDRNRVEIDTSVRKESYNEYFNYVSKSACDGASYYYPYIGACYMNAIFTNDESKLVDIDMQIYYVKTGEDAKIIEKAPEPARKVVGTEIYFWGLTDENTYVTEVILVCGYNSILQKANYIEETRGYFFSDYIGLFGNVDEVYVFIAEKSKMTLIETVNIVFDYPYANVEEYDIYTYNLSEYTFVEKGHGLFIEPPNGAYNRGFLYWTNEAGDILSYDLWYYFSGTYDSKVKLKAYFDRTHKDFPEVDGALRYNLISNGTEWEVQYNYGAKQSFATVEIPAFYKGKPVTKIADYGFATRCVSWDGNKNGIDRYEFSYIEHLIVPATVLEVGRYAFATMYFDISFMVHSPFPFFVEFLSEDTKVHANSFTWFGGEFTITDGQLRCILEELCNEWLDLGGHTISILTFEAEDRPNVGGYFSLENPYAINIVEDYAERFEAYYVIYVLLHEFRHLYQFASCNLIDGVTVKRGAGERTVLEFLEGIKVYNTDPYVLEHDAGGFALSILGTFLG